MRTCILAIATLSVLLGARGSADELVFLPVKIDGPVHDPANHTYWYGPFSECASVADFDGDGDLDIAAGRNWYEAPDWTRHSDFRDGAETNGPETDNNSEFAMDVNRDGRPDIVSSGWMRMKGAFWYENPGPAALAAGRRWPATRIHSALSMEGVIHGDIDGDGDDDILCNHWSLKPGQGMTWIEHLDQAPWLVEHVIGTEGETHGNGLGDINGDGRCDIVTQVGWYEGPEHPTRDPWVFHADYKFEVKEGSSAASHPILIHDVNEDGLNDIIIGASHTYGLAWLEQKRSALGAREFEQHWVETDFGQFHTMALDDLDGDGRKDLVTGKRLLAHHGRDISCYDPLFAFWYEIDHGRWTRRLLAYNHLVQMPDDLTQRNPAPNFVPAVGMKLNTADMDADGDKDIVVAGKGGLYIFYNAGRPQRGGPPFRMPPEENYPSWTGWQDEWPTPEKP